MLNKKPVDKLIFRFDVISMVYKCCNLHWTFFIFLLRKRLFKLWKSSSRLRVIRACRLVYRLCISIQCLFGKGCPSRCNGALGSAGIKRSWYKEKVRIEFGQEVVFQPTFYGFQLPRILLQVCSLQVVCLTLSFVCWSVRHTILTYRRIRVQKYGISKIKWCFEGDCVWPHSQAFSLGSKYHVY